MPWSDPRLGSRDVTARNIGGRQLLRYRSSHASSSARIRLLTRSLGRHEHATRAPLLARRPFAADRRALVTGRAGEAIGGIRCSCRECICRPGSCFRESPVHGRNRGVVFDGVLPGTASTTTAQNPPSRQALPLGNGSCCRNRPRRPGQSMASRAAGRTTPGRRSVARQLDAPRRTPMGGSSLDFGLRVRHKYCKVPSYFSIVLHLLAQKVGQS